MRKAFDHAPTMALSPRAGQGRRRNVTRGGAPPQMAGGYWPSSQRAGTFLWMGTLAQLRRSVREGIAGAEAAGCYPPPSSVVLCCAMACGGVEWRAVGWGEVLWGGVLWSAVLWRVV